MRREHGQATIEFAIIGIALLMLTVGLVDVGRAFYQYNAVSAAARYGARWGSVVGGTCSGLRGASSSDWCNQYGTGNSGGFWSTPGNYPLNNTLSCPQKIVKSQLPPYSKTPYYRVSDYMQNTSTTIVGAIGQRFDTDSSTHTQLIVGGLTPGFDLSQLYVCIQLPSVALDPATSQWNVGYGDTITVFVYYPFTPAGPLFGNTELDLIASSQYQRE